MQIPIKINNSILYRFLLPIFPFGSIFSMISVIIFDFSLAMHVVFGFVVGIFVSEILYHFFKDEIHIYEEKIVVLRGGKERKVIYFNEISKVHYSKKNNYSEGSLGYGPITKYFKLELLNGKIYHLQFEAFYFNEKMKNTLVQFKKAGISLNEFALKKIK